MQPALKKDFTLDGVVLAVSLALAKGSWKMALHDGMRDKPAIHTVSHEQAAGRLAEAVAVIEQTKAKWQLRQETPVMVVYEAGQDGFWIERALLVCGYGVQVIDPASIPVERHARRAKTDPLDVRIGHLMQLKGAGK